MSAKLCTPKVAKSFPRRKYASPRGNASSNGQSFVDPISATNANRSAMFNGFSSQENCPKIGVSLITSNLRLSDT